MCVKILKSNVPSVNNKKCNKHSVLRTIRIIAYQKVDYVPITYIILSYVRMTLVAITHSYLI